MTNGKVTYRTLYKAGVQGGRGGKDLASVRQKANHRKKNLRRRTDLSMGRETYAASASRTTHNAIIVLQVLMKSRALSAECLLGLQHSVLSALKCARFTVH